MRVSGEAFVHVRHLPTVEALVDNDDDRVSLELCLLEAREDLARAKFLVDRAEQWLELGSDQIAACGQPVATELARLGCRMVVLASALSRIDDA